MMKEFLFYMYYPFKASINTLTALLSAICEYKKKCTRIIYYSDLFFGRMDDITMCSHTLVYRQIKSGTQHNQPRARTLFCETGLRLWMAGLLPIEAASLFGRKMNPQGTWPKLFIVYAVCGQVQIGNQLSN